MTRILLQSVTLVLLAQSMWSAEDEAGMVTDRPDFTESSSVVAPGTVQAELGAAIARNRVEKTDVYTILGGLVRYGIGSNGELRIASSYLHQRSDRGGKETATNGVGGMLIGGKLNLLRENPDIVELALLAHIHLPVGDELFRPRSVEPEVILAVTKLITGSINLGINLGGRRNSAAGTILMFFSTAAGFNLSGNVGVFAEYFGFYLDQSSPAHNFDAGLTWLVHPSIQLDISGGVSPSGEPLDYFAGAGISFRLGK